MKKGIIALALLVAMTSCGNGNTTKSNNNDCATKAEAACVVDCGSCATSCSAQTKGSEAPIVEVLYMHGKQRCVTCRAIGTEAEALIGEMANDQVAMRTIDFSTAEGEKIADKYEVASSSLLVVSGDKVENVTAMSFQYAKNNPEQFKKNLKEVIQKMVD